MHSPSFFSKQLTPAELAKYVDIMAVRGKSEAYVFRFLRKYRKVTIEQCAEVLRISKEQYEFLEQQSDDGEYSFSMLNKMKLFDLFNVEYDLQEIMSVMYLSGGVK